MRHILLTTGRIRERVTFREGADFITLVADIDPLQLRQNLLTAQSRLTKAMQHPETADYKEAAMDFASCFFGAEQAAQLMEFYKGNANAVMLASSKYFESGLNKRVLRAQRKAAKKA